MRHSLLRGPLRRKLDKKKLLKKKLLKKKLLKKKLLKKKLLKKKLLKKKLLKKKLLKKKSPKNNPNKQCLMFLKLIPINPGCLISVEKNKYTLKYSFEFLFIISGGGSTVTEQEK